MSSRPGFRDTFQNWNDPTADEVLGDDEDDSQDASAALNCLTPRMFEVLSTLAETGSATDTARIHGISRDRVYQSKRAAQQRIEKMRELHS